MKQTKKGFTLVELLVVIAILAILASVSIVGYTSFIAKANLSNDQATISMINRNLQAEWLTEKPASAGEAFASLYSLGFSSEKLIPYSGGFHYVYDLSANQMYLFDKDDKLVYPENASPATSDLWAQYRDRADDVVDGVTNYIAMQPVTEQSANFTTVFASGSYNLDLNGYYLDREMHDGVEITVLNGAITPASNGFTAGEGTTELEKLEQPLTDTTKEVVVENKIIETASAPGFTVSGEKVILRNCLIIRSAGDTSNGFSVAGNEIIIEDCTFTTVYAHWALTVKSPEEGLNGKVVIRNNTFINAARGINLSLGYESVVIEGNTFNLGKDAKSNAIQINLNSPESFVLHPNQLAVGAIVIKNNNFENCNAAMVLHNQLISSANVVDDDTSTTLGEWKNAIANHVTFENNTFGEIGSGEKVIADPDASQLTTEEQRQTMAELEDLFQQKVK